jgi:orotidine-5'-phosphate decarboxylase
MQTYKAKFIDFLLRSGALRVGGDYSLDSKRISPWFVNVGNFDDGYSSAALGEYYADLILDSGADFDLIYGIPEKGIAIALATAIGLNKKGRNVPWFFTRKTPKDYGEATNLSQADRIKALVVGRAPKSGQSIVQLDDVFTAEDTKYYAREVLQSLGDFNFPVLAISVDRQEVGVDGRNAIEDYKQKTGTNVVSIVNALDIYNLLMENAPLSTPSGKIRKEGIARMATYLRVYGTESARKSLERPAEKRIIESDRSIIPACDVPTLEEFEYLVRQTADVDGIGGYKIGFELGLGHGLGRVVETARKHTNKPLIYDHQKAGTDIPETGINFARVCKKAGVDAVILFPQAGPETERSWIYHALDNGLGVIVGGRMTHPAYSQSEGGFISDEGVLKMYAIAAMAGVNNFVVPGNKPDVIKAVKERVEAEGVSPIFYAPGFVAQGGKIEDATEVAGDRWHAIVGREIYQASDMKSAALEHTRCLNTRK